VRAGGDVILTVAGRRVDAAEGLARIVSEELHPGQTVTFAFGLALARPRRPGARR
jgi:S1-C subfamily serine protease